MVAEGRILVPNDAAISREKANGAAVQGGLSVAGAAGVVAFLTKLVGLDLTPEQQMGIAAISVPVCNWLIKFVRDYTKKRYAASAEGASS